MASAARLMMTADQTWCIALLLEKGEVELVSFLGRGGCAGCSTAGDLLPVMMLVDNYSRLIQNLFILAQK